MDQIKMDIYFNENYDYEAVDDICQNFEGATLWYDEGRLRFEGTPERCQELIRAIKTVETIRKTFTF